MKGLLQLTVLIQLVICIAGDGQLPESMKKGIKKLGEHCMKTVGATIEEMETIKSGPPYKGKAACVVACIFDKAGIMKDKKYSKAGLMVMVTPFVFSEPKKMSRMREISSSCEKELSTVTEDECETANHIIICLRKNIPQLSEIKLT